MSVPFQHRRGSTATRVALTPLASELYFDTDTEELYIGDGSTAGGILVGGGSSPSATAWAFYRAGSTGIPGWVSPLSSGQDNNASRPASTVGAGYAITSNYDGGKRVDFWNTVNSAGGDEGFNWYQKTGAASEAKLARLYGDATYVSYDLFVGGAPGVFYYSDATEGSTGTSNNAPFKIYSNNAIAVTFDTSQRATFVGKYNVFTPTTFSQLPAAGTFGRFSLITDGNTAVEGAIAAGGGSNKIWIYDDGVDWRVFAGTGNVSVSNKTTNFSALSTESGTRYTNNGAAGTVVGSLPAATVGLNFGFSVATAQILRADADGTDTINWAGTVSAAGGTIEGNVVGWFIMLECHVTGKWTVTQSQGGWTVT